jgi:tRNA modification GTPase
MHPLTDTIFAVATPMIKSGVAIIRISGAQAQHACMALTQRATPAPRIATLCTLTHPQQHYPIDSALVIWFPAPHSFTGEDTLELHTHGSIAVLEELLGCLGKLEQCRMAQPGEFARRAFFNGKMDLTEAEGLADLIEAETQLQARQAYAQSQGALRHLYAKWREDLLQIAALIEAYIDFPDEDIPPQVRDDAETHVRTLVSDIQTHLADSQRGEKLRQGLHVAIIGAPNAGKSSLINRLCQRDVAIVSDIAGTTRDSIEVHLNLHGYPVTLIDTAGLRESNDSIETLGIARTQQLAQTADVILMMVDCTHPIIPQTSAPTNQSQITLYAANKSDLAGTPPTLPQTTIALSAKTGEGLDGLLDALEEAAKAQLALSESPVITRQRHRALLTQACVSLEAFDLSLPPELCSEDIRTATHHLAEITGIINNDAILDRLFSSFCIGK